MTTVIYSADSINSTIYYSTHQVPKNRPHLKIVLDKTQGVSAILTKGSQSFLIEKEWIHGVPTWMTLKKSPTFFKNTYVMLSCSIEGGYIVRIQRKALGGDFYSEKRLMIEEHLRLIVNPYLLMRIRAILSNYIDGLKGLVLDVPLPEDTRECLSAFSKAIIEKYNSQECSLESSKSIQKDINELIASIPELKEPWKELNFFYKLPTVIKLRNNDQQKLLKMIEQDGDISEIVLEMLSSPGSDFDRAVFDKEVIAHWKEANPGSTITYNWRTLASQIVEEKPPAETFKDLILKGASYFINKQIAIQDTQIIQSKIIEAYFVDAEGKKTENRIPSLQQSLVLILELQLAARPVKVIIHPNWTVQTITTIANYGLWEAIEADFVKEFEPCVIYDQSHKWDLSNIIAIKKISKGHLSIEVTFCDKQENETHIIKKTVGLGMLQQEKVTFSALGVSISGSIICEESDCRSFNQRFRLFKEKKATAKEIVSETINQKIQVIVPRIDANQIYRETCLAIEYLLKELRELIGGNLALLATLIDSFVQSGLKAIDIHLVNDAVIIEKLRKTSDLFTSKMNNPKTQEDILTQVVQDVNYLRFVKTSNGIFVVKLMELLKEADERLKTVENKDGVLFIGNTGAGKSTLVCDLLDYELKSDINAIGEHVWKLDPKNVSFTTPRIGQSLGTSETLYAQGFPVSAEGIPSINIVDMPGLHETRGLQYEVCSHISVDQTIESMREIKGIVLVATLATLLDDRGNHLIKLIKEVSSMFPQIFLKDSEARKRIHIAVTKTGNHNHQVIASLKNGLYISELLYEVNQEIDRQKAEIGPGIETDDLLKGLQFQKQVWELLEEMKRDNRIRVIKVGDNIFKNDLKASYYGQEFGSVDKTQYCPAMENEDRQSEKQQREFADNLTRFAGAWRKQILEKYLIDLPSNLREVQSERAAIIAKVNEEQSDRENTRATLEEKKENQLAWIKKLQEPNAKNRDDIAIEAEVAMEQSLNIRHRERRLLKKIKHDCQSRIVSTKEAILKKKESIKIVEDVIGKLLASIAEKSTGYCNVELASYDGGKDEKDISFFLTTPKTTEKTFRELRRTKLSELGEKKTYNKHEFRGSLLHEVYIDKEFPLFSENASGEYIPDHDAASVMISGYNSTVQRSVRGEEGKRILYHIETLWDGSTLPWYSLTCRLQKKLYHQAELDNMQGDVDDFFKTMASHQRRLGELELELETDENHLRKVESDLCQHEQETKLLIAKQKEVELEKMLESAREELQKIGKEQKVWELDYKAWEANNREKIARSEDKCRECKMKKRDLAIVIKTRINTARHFVKLARKITRNKEMLRAGAGLVLNAKTVSDNVFEECSKFLTFCSEERLAEVLQECDKDLALC